MADLLSHLSRVLVEVVLPNLKSIKTYQLEQRKLSEQLQESTGQFRVEMLACFRQMRGELASVRTELDVALETLREIEATQEAEAFVNHKSALIH